MGSKNYTYRYLALRAIKVPDGLGKLKVYGVGEEVPADAMDAKAFQRLSMPRVGFLQKVVVTDKAGIKELSDDLIKSAKPKYGKLDDEIAKAKAKIKKDKEKTEIKAAGIEPDVDPMIDSEPAEAKPKKKKKGKKKKGK